MKILFLAWLIPFASTAWAEVCVEALNLSAEVKVIKKDVCKMSDRELSISRKPVRIDSGFNVGGVNSTKDIENVSSLNGVDIETIEAQMRPGARGVRGAKSGFIGKKESLVARLKKDNDLVVDKLQLTHQILAEPLLRISALTSKNKGGPFSISYYGRHYEVRKMQTHGLQLSPFFDDAGGSSVIIVKNLDNGETLSFAELMPHLINSYGFYEGNVHYRIEPKQILKVFDFIDFN